MFLKHTENTAAVVCMGVQYQPLKYLNVSVLPIGYAII